MKFGFIAKHHSILTRTEERDEFQRKSKLFKHFRGFKWRARQDSNL
jgi:hypothetical protein